VANSTVYGGIAGDVMGRDIRKMARLRDPDEAVLQTEIERVVYPFTKSPGNIRELRNAIERAMILEESGYITAASLPIAISRPDGSLAAVPDAPEIPTDGLSLEDNERSLLVRALEKTDGNQTQAARLLRITRDTLRYKMKKFSLR